MRHLRLVPDNTAIPFMRMRRITFPIANGRGQVLGFGARTLDPNERAKYVNSPEGRSFRIGSGFSDAQRASPPPPGSWVTYRYNGLTSTGLPRFARFMRVRDEPPPPAPGPPNFVPLDSAR